MNTPLIPRTRLQFTDFQAPLVVASRVSEGQYKLARYAGVGFFFGAAGRLATCKHVLEQARDNEAVFAQDMSTGQKVQLQDIRMHPQYDFATATVPFSRRMSPLPFYTGDLYLGIDVSSIGFTFDGWQGETMSLASRIFRGNVVRHSYRSPRPIARALFEVSFPALSGFSGSPVIGDPPGFIAGMLYGNFESSIESFSYTTVEKNGTRLEERVHRVVEFGLMHSAADIAVFLRDLNEA